jgi:hypothetical protein
MTIDQFIHVKTWSIYQADYLMSVEEKSEAQEMSPEQLCVKYKHIGSPDPEITIEQLQSSPEYREDGTIFDI